MHDELVAVLEESRHWGFLGPGPVDQHLAHALAFVGALGEEPVDGPVVDLGSGGGVPGLVLAVALPRHRFLLLDANLRRTDFLRASLGRLGLDDRVVVRTERAEVSGRDPDLRHAVSVVVARSFAPPAVTAECAGPLLQTGGRLVVSEPPEDPAGLRWDPDGLAQLGMTLEEHVAGPPSLVVIRQTTPCPERFPRRTGLPAKRPLW